MAACVLPLTQLEARLAFLAGPALELVKTAADVERVAVALAIEAARRIVD